MLSIFSFVVLFLFNGDFSKGDLNLFKNNQERVIVHNPLNNTADARGRIKVGREKRIKAEARVIIVVGKTQELKQIKSILLVRNIKGEK